MLILIKVSKLGGNFMKNNFLYFFGVFDFFCYLPRNRRDVRKHLPRRYFYFFLLAYKLLSDIHTRRENKNKHFGVNDSSESHGLDWSGEYFEYFPTFHNFSFLLFPRCSYNCGWGASGKFQFVSSWRNRLNVMKRLGGSSASFRYQLRFQWPFDSSDNWLRNVS